MNQKNRQQHRPYFTALVVASVDGRISLSSSSTLDWRSKEERQFFKQSFTRFDAVVVGRNTYKVAAKRLRKRNTFVFSNRIKTTARRGSVTFVNPENINVAEMLKGYKNVAVLGAGRIYSFMLEHEMLDELFVTIEPLIFGRGKKMFVGGTATTEVKLLSVRKLNNHGTMLLRYQIRHH